MNEQQLRGLLAEVADRRLSADEAVARLRRLPFEQLDCATIDHHRAIRCGHPEVIFCQGKTTEQVVQIAERLAEGGGTVLATRMSEEQRGAIAERFAEAIVSAAGRAALIHAPPMAEDMTAPVALICAGTADLPVAEEAALTLRSMGAAVQRFTDVGVSGLHRLLASVETLQDACAVVVIAGMEGALPSVVGGLVSCPVYAVPTSVGYGASFGGLAALLGMLNSCAANVCTVNIDNGFGAAFSAGLIWRQLSRVRSKR